MGTCSIKYIWHLLSACNGCSATIFSYIFYMTVAKKGEFLLWNQICCSSLSCCSTGLHMGLWIAPRQNKFPNILCDRKVKFLSKFACHQQSVGENKETHSSEWGIWAFPQNLFPLTFLCGARRAGPPVRLLPAPDQKDLMLKHRENECRFTILLSAWGLERTDC